MKKRGRTINKIITFIGSFIAALSIIAQFFPSFFSFLDDNLYSYRLVLIFVVVLLIGLFFLNWKQSQDETDVKFQAEHNATHRYAHLIRDTIYESKKLTNGTTNDSLALHILTTFANGTVACIQDSLSEYVGVAAKNDLVVCIKILDFMYWDNSKIDDRAKVPYRTLVRSIVPRGSLQADDAVSHRIEECTAFYRVFCDGKHDWTGIKLNKKNNVQIVTEDIVEVGQTYCDTCANWDEHFTNKIVVPIRIKLSEIDDKYMNTDKRNLFGFICIEYQKSNLIKISGKTDKELISICDYLKTYADSMYVVFDNIYNCMSYSIKEAAN